MRQGDEGTIDIEHPVDAIGIPGTWGVDGQFDGGDSAAIAGTILALERIPTTVLPHHLAFFIGRDAPVRYPDSTKWYGQEDRFSRDQLIPMICAGIRLKKHWTIDRIFKWHRKRWFLFAWNTRKNGYIDTDYKWPDITGPEIWALWLRYKKPWWRHGVLWILDFETLIGSIVWKFRKDNVCRNHMLACIVSRYNSPTIISRIAFKLNNWPRLILKWINHTQDVFEFDTGYLFWRWARD